MGTSYFSDKEIMQMIEDDNAKCADHRFERLKFFFNIATKEEAPFPGVLVLGYYEDAKRCWYDGSFIPTIVMTRLAFEALFHHHYLLTQNGRIKSLAINLNDATFEDLLNAAENDRYIMSEEAEKIRHIDRIYFSYFRPTSQRDETIQEMKVKLADPKIHGDMVKKNAEDEAREAIQMLADILPDICKRNVGL